MYKKVWFNINFFGLYVVSRVRGLSASPVTESAITCNHADQYLNFQTGPTATVNLFNILGKEGSSNFLVFIGD